MRRISAFAPRHQQAAQQHHHHPCVLASAVHREALILARQAPTGCYQFCLCSAMLRYCIANPNS
jgi:hypothetical protein